MNFEGFLSLKFDLIFLSLDGDGGDPADAEERRGPEERVHREVDAVEVGTHRVPEKIKPMLVDLRASHQSALT